MRTDRKENGWEREENLQGCWSVVTDVHILGHPEPVLSLNMTQYEQGSAATAVET